MKIIFKLFGILALCMAMTLAFTSCGDPSNPNENQNQGENIYKIDLSKLPASNEENTATFNKSTGTITIDRHGNEQDDAGIYCWLDNMDVSAYNIIRIKYEALGDVGFNLFVDCTDDSIRWHEKGVYCPSYMTEIVFPITAYPKNFNGLYIEGAYHTNTEQFIIKEIAFEKVSNPQITNIHLSNAQPVIDTATQTTIDADADAWDFVQDLGTGFNYWPFMPSSLDLDFGLDSYNMTGYSRANANRDILEIKNKGFKTIRIQTNPGNHFIDDEYTIDPRFIDDLKNFVDQVIEEDMYVIICGFFWPLNLRHSQENQNRINPVPYKSAIVNETTKTQSEALLRAFWTQIGKAFNNSYDEHLIFETMNEPGDDLHPERDEGHDYPIDLDCPVCQSDIEIGNGYNQLIVDSIRATGGNNANRFIMIAAFGWPYSSYFEMPEDDATNKLIPITHIYPLGVEGWETFVYSDEVKNAITDEFELMDEYFFNEHIPVYVSETGATQAIDMDQRIDMMEDFMEEVNKNGRFCNINLWMDPYSKDGNSHFCYYNVRTGQWLGEAFVNAVISATQGN